MTPTNPNYKIYIDGRVRELNVQINQQLKRAGVINKANTKVINPLETLPQSEWKSWITDLIKYRDTLLEELNTIN